jgi:putative AbiEii toxin of type IV toxin-antitoxin system/AAA ATPase-like protein
MLTSLEIENFKGIAARQHIDFAPLTLLFGANSAGKSTILQSLLYLHELIERGSADVDRTELGGNVLELGGFARLVHRHDTDRTIVLRAEFATPGSLERFGRDLTDFPFPDLDDEIDSAWIELTIRFRTLTAFRGPIVERVVIGVNGDTEPFVWLETGATLREGEPLHARINMGHPVLASASGEVQRTIVPHWGHSEVTEAWQAIAIPEDGAGGGDGSSYEYGTGAGVGLGDGRGFGDGRSLPVFALVRGRLSALPAPGEPLRVVVAGNIESDKEELVSLRRHPDSHAVREKSESLAASIALREGAARDVRTFLEMVVLGTTAQLASFLRDAPYIGPLRTIPPRGFLYERVGRTVSWADGLAAWDLLLADRLNLVERTNAWLRRLGAGCQVVVQQLFEGNADAEDLSSGHTNKTVCRLLLDTGAGSFVLPSEVGAGISQLVPVVVAAIEGRGGLTLIEQPELHIHPRLQTDLGDLFVVASARRHFLIETHSEHLILRALRRIRETTAAELNEHDPPFTPDKLSVIYVETTPAGTTFKRLRVDETGEFVDRWPHGFFEERAKELF